jgi:hypothetical protein
MSKVTYDDYTKAMREIILYDCLTPKQINAMGDEQLRQWELKKQKALRIKREYEKTKKRLDN